MAAFIVYIRCTAFMLLILDSPSVFFLEFFGLFFCTQSTFVARRFFSPCIQCSHKHQHILSNHLSSAMSPAALECDPARSYDLPVLAFVILFSLTPPNPALALLSYATPGLDCHAYRHRSSSLGLERDGKRPRKHASYGRCIGNSSSTARWGDGTSRFNQCDW